MKKKKEGNSEKETLSKEQVKLNSDKIKERNKR